MYTSLVFFVSDRISDSSQGFALVFNDAPKSRLSHAALLQTDVLSRHRPLAWCKWFVFNEEDLDFNICKEK